MKAQTAKSLACKLFYATSFQILQKMPRLDMRFNFNKEVMKEIKKMKANFSNNEKEYIKQVRKIRAERKINTAFLLFDNPIVKDYISNKNNIIHIADDHIHFAGGRNHWAKNDHDLKIIAVLKKYR